MSLVLHPLTELRIGQVKASPPHALLITGPAGSGKYTVAVEIIREILNIGNPAEYAYGLIISSQDGKAIGIEAVRELQHFLSLKVPLDKDLNRFIIFENAHLLTVEAQNALLKTLEEPPKATILILTVNNEQSLLPTIRSRAQILNVTAPSKDDIISFFQRERYSPKLISQAYAISGGLPGLMHAMLAHEDHPLMQATEIARKLLSQSSYERLLNVDELARNKEMSANIAFIIQQMAHISLQSATGPAAAKWQRVLASSYKASEALAANGQPKLVLTNLMLSL